MAQSAFINPPIGSALKFYVDSMPGVDPALRQSDDDNLKFFGNFSAFAEEHRLWKLPFDVVRNFVLRQSLEAKDGKEKTDRLFDEHPDIVNELARLKMEYAFQKSTQRERAPRRQSPKTTAHMITAAVFIIVGSQMPGATFCAKALVAGKRLGVSRYQVGRAVKHFLQACRRLDAMNGASEFNPCQGHAAMILPLLMDFIAECDAERAKKLRKKP